MSDIVSRMRRHWKEITDMDGGECGEMALFREAADEIERLREALDVIAAPLYIDGDDHMWAVKHARAALSQDDQ